MSLQPQDQAFLLRLARKTLESSFQGERTGVLEEALERLSPQSPLREARPCFVTIYEREMALRGCIGCIVTRDMLVENVHKFTQRAAFEDPRFPPVSQGEFSGLNIQISVLGPLMPIPYIMQIEIGRHGLLVRSGSRQGVLLADVATRYQWSKEKFLKETCQKAGLPLERLDSYQIFYFEQQSFAENHSPK